MRSYLSVKLEQKLERCFRQISRRWGGRGLSIAIGSQENIFQWPLVDLNSASNAAPCQSLRLYTTELELSTPWERRTDWERWSHTEAASTWLTITFKTFFLYVLTKATRLLSVLRRLRSSLDQESLSHMYLTYIRPILEYACTAWGNLGTTQVDRLERFQRRAAKIILRRPLFAPSNHDELLATIGWPSLASRRKYFQAVLGHRMATSNVPQHLRDYIPSRPTHMHNTRKPPFFQLPTTNTSLMLNSPLYQAADTFNALPAILQSASNLTSFKNGAALFLLTCQCTCSKHTSK